MSTAPLFKTASRPIRSRLFRDLVLLILFTAGLLALVAWGLISELKRDLAAARVGDATQMAREEIGNFLLPLSRQLVIARDSLVMNGAAGLEPERLNARFIPILRHLEQISGAILADQFGGEYFLRREADQWLVSQRDPERPGLLTWTRLDAQGAPLATWETPWDLDPRERPWYQAAMGAGGQVGWSDPYQFQSLKLPGVTAAITWESKGETRVLAFDLLLGQILDFLGRLPLGPEGKAFLLDAGGGIYLPDAHGQQGPDQGDFFSAHEQHGGPLLFDATAAWRAAGRPSEELVPFSSGGQPWLGGFRPLSDNPSGAWFGIAMPESSGAALTSRWPVLALTTLVIAGLGIALAAVVIRKYSRQLRDLPRLTIDRANPERDLYDLIGRGEDAHLEFKSTMRQNLHTGRPGKEIELAWLKGVTAFLNTEGGIVLLGVADEGNLLGLDADGFENDDKCLLHFKNLLNQHLGAEYAQQVRFELYELEGKRIGAVECERSRTPAFLRAKNNEEAFLIRTGPSNIELSLSRALKYIQDRA
ncbi:MAG: RNA-binding domain-containing protein [Chromatiaceae bacterium]